MLILHKEIYFDLNYILLTLDTLAGTILHLCECVWYYTETVPLLTISFVRLASV